ncbi:MAG: phage gp6-like head-tail connector protein [Bacteroidales bacterium]|nr:phage gp6-like head-tail connector protein [Bacteroidales bacterium]MBR7051605.1 phage gp6-like head-tail connector protein [Bacteroidaceae bacterium]
MPHIDYLPRFRRQCKADDGIYDEPCLIDCMEDAFAKVISMTHRTEEELVALGDGELPSEIVRAAMMLGAYWYDQREAAAGASIRAVDYSVENLVRPFRKFKRT